MSARWSSEGHSRTAPIETFDHCHSKAAGFEEERFQSGAPPAAAGLFMAASQFSPPPTLRPNAFKPKGAQNTLQPLFGRMVQITSDPPSGESFMTPRAAASEQRLRNGYPPLFRALGISEEDIEAVMAGYDDPVVRTTRPVSAAFL